MGISKRVNFLRAWEKRIFLKQIQEAIKRVVGKEKSDDIQKMIDESW